TGQRGPGPRAGGGGTGGSRNAYRHGLTLSITSTAAFAKQLDILARKIADDSEDAIVLERARAIAQAELDLARVRRAKLALIERASAFGELDPPQLTVTQMIRILNAYDRGGRLIIPKPIDALATTPSQEPDRSAEAVRRGVPELRKLERYERRAAARRDRTLFNVLMEQRICSCKWQNEANFSKFIQWVEKLAPYASHPCEPACYATSSRSRFAGIDPVKAAQQILGPHASEGRAGRVQGYPSK